MGRRPEPPLGASCSCIFCSPTGCPPRGEVGRRPASGQSSRQGTSPARASADGSLGSAARSRCWYGCASGARRENRSRSAFPQFRPHSRRSPPKQQHFRTLRPSCGAGRCRPRRRMDSARLARVGSVSSRYERRLSCSAVQFSDIVCCLLSEWCVVTSFYQSLQAMSSFMRFSICAPYCTLSYNKVCLIK